MTDSGASGLEHPVTWERFIELDDDDRRELIDGELVEVEVPGVKHEVVVAALVARLVPWAREHDAGRVLASGYKVRASDTRGVMPDLQLLSNETLATAPSGGLDRGRPELVVEVISPGSPGYDRVVKLGWYASLGVPEYWIVDPEAQTIERLVLEGERYAIAQTARADDTFEPEGFPGLSIPLSELWL